MHNRIARETWTPPVTMTWERFLTLAHGDAQVAQARELAKTADAEDLRAVAKMANPDILRGIVEGLIDRATGAEFAARVNHNTLREMWRAKR